MLHTLIHGTQLVLTEPTTLKAQTLDRNESIRQMLSMLSGELQKIQHENSSGQCLHLTGLHDLLATAIGATSSRRTRSGTGGKKLLDLIEASNPPQPKTKATVEARSWIRIAIARAMTILYNYIVNRHDLSHPCNDTHVGWLQEAMKAGADVLNRMPLMKSWL